jgi:hypothetical protein
LHCNITPYALFALLAGIWLDRHAKYSITLILFASPLRHIRDNQAAAV